MAAADLGFASVCDATMPDIGTACAETWTEGIEQVTELWRRDVDRRAVLRGSLFAATACGAPVLRWLVGDDAEHVRRTAARVQYAT